MKTASSAVLSQKQVKERLCCIFPGSMMENEPVIAKKFREEIATLLESSKMKKNFQQHEKLMHDESPADRTEWKVDGIMKLLTICLETHFKLVDGFILK